MTFGYRREEREPRRRATFLKGPLIVRDDDFERLVKSDERDIILCTPIEVPIGTRRGVFVFVEGVTQKFTQQWGKPHRLVAVVRRKRTKRTAPGQLKTVEVELTGIAELPRDGWPSFTNAVP